MALVIVIMRMPVPVVMRVRMRMSMVIISMIVPTAGFFMAVVMAAIMGMIVPTSAVIMVVVVSMIVITTIFLLGRHGGEVEQSHGHTTDATDEHHGGEDSVFANILALGQSTAGMKVNHNAAPEEKEKHTEEMGADT